MPSGMEWRCQCALVSVRIRRVQCQSVARGIMPAMPASILAQARTSVGADSVARARSSAEASSELAEFLDLRQQRRRLFPLAALVGLVAGMVAVLFRLLLAGGEVLRNALIGAARSLPLLGWLAPVAFGVLGALAAVTLVRHYAPEAAGSGIPHTKAVLYRLRPLRWRRVLAVKLLGGTLAIGAGLALGREGPTVQMGGAVGAAVADGLRATPRERLTLIATGAGAGLAAAFNAPLSGLVFVLEEMQRDFRPAVIGAAFVAAAVADIVSRLVAGPFPIFAVPDYPVPPLLALPAFAVLGLVTGLAGVLFNRGLLGALNLFAHLQGRAVYGAVAAVGAFVGLIGWFTPALIGGGHHVTETTLFGAVPLAAVPLLFGLRFGLTLLSYGTGAPGGIFAPLLMLGALIGLGVGDVIHRLAPAMAPIPGAFAVVGMAAYFTAIVRAPLTGIVLIVEMTGNYHQMLPLLVACFGAYLVAEGFGQLPIYEALLQRDLRRHGGLPSFHDPIVLEIEVAPGAPFVGQAIHELGLPPGCIVVRCRDGAREWVPTAATRLTPHLRLTAVIAPEAAAGLRRLREGCEPPAS